MGAQNTNSWLPDSNVLPTENTVTIDVRGTTLTPEGMSQAIQASQGDSSDPIDDSDIFMSAKKETFLQKYWLVILVAIIVAVVVYKNKKAV